MVFFEKTVTSFTALALESLFDKLTVGLQLYQKETVAQVFFL